MRFDALLRKGASDLRKVLGGRGPKGCGGWMVNGGPTLMEPTAGRTTPTPENVRIRVGYAFPSIK